MRKVVGSVVVAANGTGAIRLSSNRRERISSVRLWSTAPVVYTGAVNALTCLITLPLGSAEGLGESTERSLTQGAEVIAIPLNSFVDVPVDGIDEEFSVVDVAVTASNSAGPSSTVCAALVVDTPGRSSSLSQRA